MRRVRVNSALLPADEPIEEVAKEEPKALDSVDALEMATILNHKYTSVKELKDSFIVSAETGPMLVYKDHTGKWVGVPFQTIGGHHHLKEDGSY